MGSEIRVPLFMIRIKHLKILTKKKIKMVNACNSETILIHDQFWQFIALAWNCTPISL